MGENWLERTEYEYKKEVVKTTGTLQKAMDFYDSHKISHIKLFHDYCDGQNVDGNAYNKWDTFFRGQNIPVRAHMSIDERAFDEFAWKTLKTEPTTMISVLFYNGKRNESAYECGFFSEEIKRAGDNTVLVNPSPFLVKGTNCKKYIVLDNYFAEAYKLQFRDKKFETYEDCSCKDPSESVFLLCHVKEDIEVLSKYIEKGRMTLAVSIPISLFYENRDSILYLLSENNLKIEKILLLDPNIFENNPKKRIVLYLSSGNENVLIPIRFLSLNGDKMVVLDYEGSISKEQISNSKLSYAKELKRICKKDDEREIKRRKQPDSYYYSREIRISLKYVTRNNESYPIISYYSIPDDNGRSKKIYPDSEKGLRGKTGEELYHAINKFILEEDIRDIIINDVKKGYANDRLLTLKTLWYIYRPMLLQNNQYDDDFCRNLFEDTRFFLKDRMHEEFINGAANKDLKKYFYNKTLSEQTECINQLYLLFSLLFKERVFLINPISELKRELSTRMDEEQYEVRNALTKKYFTIEEQISLLNSGHKRKTWIDSRSYETFVIMFRLLSSVPILEMLALTWKDIEEVKDYGFYKLNVFKKVNRVGEKKVFGQNNDWRRFRSIPLVPELAKMALRYKREFMNKMGIEEENDLNEVPIFATEYNRKTRKAVQAGYDKLYLICKKAIDSLGIPPLEIILPGTNEIETDLNRYYSDIFVSNFRHCVLSICGMTQGEASYILGVNAEDTFSNHYCDYTNDAIQYAMYQKLIRWTVLLHQDTEMDFNRLSEAVELNLLEFEEDEEVSFIVSNRLGFDLSIKKKGEK